MRERQETHSGEVRVPRVALGAAAQRTDREELDEGALGDIGRHPLEVLELHIERRHAHVARLEAGAQRRVERVADILGHRQAERDDAKAFADPHQLPRIQLTLAARCAQR